jgi:hypothetical protein
MAGIVHEWITSAAVISIRISNCIGTTIRLSTSKIRNSPFPNSEVGSIYESNCILGKSEYSYLQYHWCPIALIVTDGELISSVRYSNRKEGKAKNSNRTAGSTVHTVSISCASENDRDVNLFVSRAMNIYTTTDVTSVKITIA